MRSGVNSKLITGTTVRRCMRAHNAQHLRQNEKDFCAQAPSWPCSKGCAHAIYKRVSFSDGAQFPASSPPVPRTVPATVPRCDLRGDLRLRQYAKNTCFGTITPLMYAVLVFSQITAGNCAGNCAGNWRGTVPHSEKKHVSQLRARIPWNICFAVVSLWLGFITHGRPMRGRLGFAD